MEPVHVHIPFASLKDYLDLLRKRKYDLEIFFSAAVLDQLDRGDVEQALASLDWGPALTLHAPFMDLNPGAVDPMVRSVTQMRFKKLLGVAAVLKPRAAVFHTGWDRWRYAGRTDLWLEGSLETWGRVLDDATKIGMRVAVENVFDDGPDALAELIGRVGHPDFGLCFDTGHFNLFSKPSLEEWFRRLGAHIVEVHLHDNAGDADAHRAPGTGTVDFARFFRLLREHSCRPIYTLEAHDAGEIEQSLAAIRALIDGREPAPGNPA